MKEERRTRRSRIARTGAVFGLAGALALAGLSGCNAASTSSGSSGTAANVESVQQLAKKLSFDVDEMPQATKKVVYLSGSWKEMGEQFADQANKELKRYVADGISGTVGTYGFDSARELEDKYLTYYEKHAPELVELYQGMAEGLDLSYEDFMLGIISFYDTPDEEEDSERAADTCSNIAAWGSQTESGKLIVGADWDSNGSAAYYMPTVVAYPDEGNAFISESSFQGNLVMNDKGLVVSGSSGQNASDDDTGMGIPVMCAQWLNAANSSTAEEAEKNYIKHYLTTYGDNANLNDVEGGHVVVEATQAHHATRTSGDFGETDYLIATNDFMTDEMQSSLLPAGSGYDDCRPRYYTEEAILKRDAGHATARTIADALGSTAYTEDGTTWVEDNWNAETGLNSPEAVSPYYQNIMKAIAVPEDGSYYVMNGCSNTQISQLPHANGTYVQIKLEASAAESAQAARETANTLIYSAGSAIDHATDDTTEAKEALNSAKEELVRGDAYMTKAGMQTGARAQKLISRAASAYLRAQDYAQKAIGDPQAVLDL